MKTNGLARAALRFKPASFAGTFVALMMAAMIVSACGILLESGLRATVPPERYAQVPVLVTADQRAHIVVGSGEDRSDEYEPLPDTARLSAATVRKVAAVPGVAAAVPDVSFPVLDGRRQLTAHGWGSTAFGDVELVSGGAPGAGEVVVDQAVAGARVGGTITLTTADGPHVFRVSGVVRTAQSAAGVWFADAEAVRLSGHPGQVDAVAVFAKNGIVAKDLAERVRKTVGGAADVHTGVGRGAAEEPALAGAKELLIGLGGSFGGIATMVAIFTAAGTVALSVGQRAREFALLRAVGATPRQIRRSIAAEAMLVAPLAGLAGCLPGVALAYWWFGQFKERGVIPGPVRLTVSWIPLATAVGVGLLTALVAGLLAARRPAKIKPSRALGEADVQRLRPGVIRTLLGLAALVGGAVLAGVAASQTGDDAANTAAGIVMLFMVAVGLLGPLVAALCARLIGLPLRAAGATPGGAAAGLAAANARTNARRLASAITPLVLAMAFGSTLVFMHTSEDHAATAQLRTGIVADHVITGTLPATTTEKAAATPGVRAAVGVLRTGVLVPIGSGSGRWLQDAPTQAVSGTGRELAAVQDLDVRTGDLDRLGLGGRTNTVALDAILAASAKVKVGDRVELWLPDGARGRFEIVATYGRGLGIAQVTLPRAAVAGHVSSAFDSAVLVRNAPGARDVTTRLGPLGTVTDRTGFAAERDEERELNTWANMTMAALLAGFAAIAAVNTLVMTVFDRRGELRMLHLIGSTRRQVLAMLRWEALLVAAAGAGIGTAIAFTTLIPLARGITGESPHVPPVLYATFVGTTLLLGVAATLLPARLIIRAKST